MSITILEVLMNAEHNLKNPVIPQQKEMGLSQLSNAIYLLFEKEKDVNDEFDEDDLKDK